MKTTVVSVALALGFLAGTARLSVDEKGAKEDNPSFAAYSRNDANTQHVFFRSSDGNIIELWTKHGDYRGWNARNLSANAKAPKAAGNPACYFLDKNNTQHVIYRGDDGQVHELYLMDKQENWAHNNLTKLTGAPAAAGNPAGYLMDSNNTQHVVYRSTDGALIELYHGMEEANKGWHSKDLTAEAKAPIAVGDPAGYFQSSNKSQHVFFRGKDGQVHELYLGDKQPRWTHNNLTAETKAAPAAGDPCGYVMSGDDTQHVVYRSIDGDVVELSHATKGDRKGWHSNNLTAGAKAPKAVGDPCGFYFKDTKTQHVYYRDAEGQIQELYLREKQDRWGANNLTAVTKCPKAASDPSAYGLDKNNTQHVIFRTDKGEIYELYHLPKGEQPGWHMNNLTAAAKLN